MKKDIFLAVFALALMGLATFHPAFPPLAAAGTRQFLSGRAFAEKSSVAGIDNFGRCNPGFCRGAQPDAAGYAWLKEQGFKSVVNFRSWHNAAEVKALQDLGLTPLCIPLQADVRGSEPPRDAQLKQFFDFVLDPRNQPVFVHCAHGKDRTGTMVALYRMEVDGWSAEEAIDFLT